MQKYLVLAEEIGFSYVKEVNREALIPREDVRAMCRADLCKSYGKCWSCPPSPLCLTPAEVGKSIAPYSRGILVQTTEDMEDAFDLEAIKAAERKHKRLFDTLVRQLRLMKVGNLPMAAGTCTRCYKCTYPDRPCRHPDKLYPSMEAYGFWVSDVCVKSGLDYRHGDKTITFTACVLIKEDE